MKIKNWQLQKPLDAVVFDCDGTLTAIEGVVYLAELNGVGEKIRVITDRVMTSGGLTPHIYAERLNAIQPTKSQINNLINVYYSSLAPHAKQVINILKTLNKEVFIISAGLYPSVRGFAEKIGIVDKNVFAVNIKFDDNGMYLDFDKSSPLTYNLGKQIIIKHLAKDYPRIAYIGDGANDLSVKDLVTRFIGYGGIFYRENIKAQCDFYLEDPDISQLLPLLLTKSETESLNQDDKNTYLDGLITLRAKSGYGTQLYCS